MEKITARQIAEKYVYGNHDAMTDNQEVEDMIKDIEQYASQELERASDTYEGD